MYVVEIYFYENGYVERNGVFEFDTADDAMKFVDNAVRHVTSTNTTISIQLVDSECEEKE